MSEQKTFFYQTRRPEETLLYKTLLENLSTFLANLQNEGRSLPRHVIKELHAYLECGVLAYGFVRLKCEDCRSEQFVAFSCKKRGFCSSCGTKKMAETAAYLVDNIIPHVKIRQYVLSVPIHLLQIEGVYELKKTGTTKFKKTKSPSNLDIKNLVMIIREKIIKHLRRSGYLKDLPPDEDPTDPLLEKEPTYASCMSASVGHQIALGKRQGQKVRFIGSGFGYTGDIPELKGRLCAFLGGFSLHAAINVPRHQRDKLGKMVYKIKRQKRSPDPFFKRGDDKEKRHCPTFRWVRQSRVMTNEKTSEKIT
jgi:hypothetical protein